MHRKEYIGVPFKSDEHMHELHRAYHGQYVDDEVKRLVVRHIGMDEIRASQDKYFNDIPLKRWDRLVRLLPHQITVALRENGDWLTLGNGVCILKEAARMLREEQR